MEAKLDEREIVGRQLVVARFGRDAPESGPIMLTLSLGGYDPTLTF